jgi:rubrerythrin
MGGVKSTRENLEDAAEGEDVDVLTIYPKFIQEAEEEGKEDAARSFKVAFEREKHHRDMFKQALKKLK